MNKHLAKNHARGQSAEALTQNVWSHLATRQPPRHEKPKRNRRIEVRPRDLAQRVDHRHDHETEGKSDSQVGDRATFQVIDYNRACPSENKRERAKRFGEISLHSLNLPCENYYSSLS